MTNAQVALLAAATYCQQRSNEYHTVLPIFDQFSQVVDVGVANKYLQWLEEQDAKIPD